MGKFIGVIAAALDQQDGDFIQTTELLDFPYETWVYYCRPQLGPPKPGWIDLAGGTLRLSVENPPFRHDRLEWQPLVTHDEVTGSYEYVSEVFGTEPGNNVFHLALPPHMLPDSESWDIPPLYGHADGQRFVLGWSISWDNARQDNHWPTFHFAPAAAGEFDERAADLDRAIRQAARQQVRQVLNAWLPPDQPKQDDLLDRLDRGLDLEEVRTLVFELGLDYDNLAGETKKGKLREMLLYLDRNGQLSHLIRHLHKPQYGHILRRA